MCPHAIGLQKSHGEGGMAIHNEKSIDLVVICAGFGIVLRKAGMKRLQQIVLVTLLGWPLAVWAALGGDAGSVQADAVQMKALSHTMSNTPDYTVHTLVLSSGTTVTEYISGNNTVFAGSWHGPVKPDLRQLLGDDNFQQLLLASQSGGHHARQVNHPGLVAESGGHMRALRGRAWVPALLPVGMMSADIH